MTTVFKTAHSYENPTAHKQLATTMDRDKDRDPTLKQSLTFYLGLDLSCCSYLQVPSKVSLCIQITFVVL